MKIGNFIFQKLFNKHSFHIPNNKNIKWLVKKLFKIRVIRGRGKRAEVAVKLGLNPRHFDSALPLKYATKLHIYLPYMEKENVEKN